MTAQERAADRNSGSKTSGSSWPKWLLGIGVGCAVVCLVGAVLVGVGVFKSVSCCFEHTQANSAVRTETFEFATLMHYEDYDGAYEMLAASRQSKLSREEFEDQLEPYRDDLADRSPFPVDSTSQVGDEGLWETSSRWRGTVQFVPRGSAEAVEMEVVLNVTERDTGGYAAEIVDWQMSRTSFDRAETRYARTALRFHRQLTQGDFDAARGMLPVGSEYSMGEQSQQAPDAFAEVMEPTVRRLDEMETVFVYALHPMGDPDKIRVELRMTDALEATYSMDFIVSKGRVYDVSGVRRVAPGSEDAPEAAIRWLLDGGE